MMKDKKYYCFNEILKFIDIPYDFERAKEYPFTRGVNNVSFSWGQIIIPKQGIRETIEFKYTACGGLIELPVFAKRCYYDYCPNCGAKMGLKDGEKHA